MSNKKIKVGIIGTGNIGSDLLFKIQKSKIFVCGMFTGINADSEGIKRAKELGIPTSTDSIGAIVENPQCCEIVFDATSAQNHLIHAPILKGLNKFVIDLTPSRIGKMCVPIVNIGDALSCDNVNLITCGGQACIPLAKVIMETHPDTTYIEIAGSISSKSAGAGTRANIEEYMQTTKSALEEFSGVPKAKVILVFNPAEPPVLMHNTIYASIPNPNLNLLKEKITEMVEKIKTYIPGYRLSLGPILDRGRVVIMVQVIGSGDFLPPFAGNLDIITCAAIKVAEEYAQRFLSNK
ncbi:MAG: acetaldehyde dehydrogenase (acetylating) [Candidatus Falkowbacteria bacterium]|nr:acetaldehyde dehydrogenase (acetylating) [Candidatus Falkowbacteria bacterium]